MKRTIPLSRFLKRGETGLLVDIWAARASLPYHDLQTFLACEDYAITVDHTPGYVSVLEPIEWWASLDNTALEGTGMTREEALRNLWMRVNDNPGYAKLHERCTDFDMREVLARRGRR